MKIFPYILALLVTLACADNSFTFQAGDSEGCGASGDCKECHSLTRQEAVTLLKEVPGEVVNVKFSEVPGLWVIDLDQKGKKIPVYIDFSKQFLLAGRVVRIATKEDVTEKRFLSLNKANIADIPLDDAIVLGNPAAPIKIIVFDDPECAFCLKLHEEIKKIVKQHNDIAFYIKMYPLQIHPEAYDKAKAIICSKSEEMLEQSLAGKPIPPPSCETDQVDKNLALGKNLYIKSTPTLIFPNGSIVPGFKSAEKILELVAEQIIED